MSCSDVARGSTCWIGEGPRSYVCSLDIAARLDFEARATLEKLLVRHFGADFPHLAGIQAGNVKHPRTWTWGRLTHETSDR